MSLRVVHAGPRLLHGVLLRQRHRLTANVGVGTNGGTAYTPPVTAPPSSDTTLVTIYQYNAAGRVQSTTDPRGVMSQTNYDALGRVTQTIDDYTNGVPTASSNSTTNYTYDGTGDELTVQAVMPSGTPSQTTQYVYGVTTDGGSDINSNDLLAMVECPDPTTGNPSTSARNQEVYTYNSLGDTLTSTDPNGDVHTYSYDLLGRQTADAVTTLGSGVDGSVRRLTTAYNSLGKVRQSQPGRLDTGNYGLPAPGGRGPDKRQGETWRGPTSEMARES